MEGEKDLRKENLQKLSYWRCFSANRNPWTFRGFLRHIRVLLWEANRWPSLRRSEKKKYVARCRKSNRIASQSQYQASNPWLPAVTAGVDQREASSCASTTFACASQYTVLRPWKVQNVITALMRYRYPNDLYRRLSVQHVALSVCDR